MHVALLLVSLLRDVFINLILGVAQLGELLLHTKTLSSELVSAHDHITLSVHLISDVLTVSISLPPLKEVSEFTLSGMHEHTAKELVLEVLLVSSSPHVVKGQG
jgi:hypothetical protein